MKTENIIRKKKNPARKDIIMSIRINKAMSDFLKEKDFAPSLIFYEALKDLGFKEKN
jgi:hypothetical protein